MLARVGRKPPKRRVNAADIVARRVQFKVLGPLEVNDGDRRIPLGGLKQRGLLAMLLLSANETVSVDRIVDGLWGESPPATAQKMVQLYVSRLRKALGQDVIRTSAPGYVADVGPEALDLLRVRELVESARRTAQTDPAAAAAELREALGLWRGEPLSDLAFEPFALSALPGLAELRETAREECVNLELSLGRHAELLPELEALVVAHPLRERLRGQLMLAQYRSGRQADALDTYRSGRQALVDALGIEPGPELQRLHAAILRQDPKLEHSAHGPAVAPGTDGLPGGTVTFLFTDIEGSTGLLKQLGEHYGGVLEEHGRILRSAFQTNGGRIVDTQGDSFFAAFGRAKEAVAAAADAQRGLAAHPWPEDVVVRVRMGLHTGEPRAGKERYVGIDVHKTARIGAAGHGGQVLLSRTTRELVEDELPPGVSVRDLGERHLKDLDRPEHLAQLVIDGLPSEFPPLKTVPVRSRRKRKLAYAGVASLGVLLAASLTGVALLREGSQPVGVVPDSVAVLDASTGKVLDDISVGEGPGPIAAGTNGVWVANRDARTVVKLDPASGEIVQTYGLAATPQRLAVGGETVWIANGYTGTISRVITRYSFISRPIRLRPGVRGLVALAAAPRQLWVGFQDGFVGRFDPESLDEKGAVKGLGSPGQIALGAGSAWVTQTVAPDVARIRATSVTLEASLSVGGSPVVTYGGRAVWVATSNGRLSRIDPKTTTIVASVPVGSSPVAVAADRNTVWVASARGELFQIDPTSNTLVRSIRLGHSIAGLVLEEGKLWATVGP